MIEVLQFCDILHTEVIHIRRSDVVDYRLPHICILKEIGSILHLRNSLRIDRSHIPVVGIQHMHCLSHERTILIKRCPLDILNRICSYLLIERLIRCIRHIMCHEFVSHREHHEGSTIRIPDPSLLHLLEITNLRTVVCIQKFERIILLGRKKLYIFVKSHSVILIRERNKRHCVQIFHHWLLLTIEHIGRGHTPALECQ